MLAEVAVKGVQINLLDRTEPLCLVHCPLKQAQSVTTISKMKTAQIYAGV